jgi:hypothetical protein
MFKTKLAGEFTNEVAREIAEIRNAAEEAQSGIRTLRETEMAWIGGGDGEPVWPH